MESITAKGKTIKEAIQKGLELLNLSDQEVQVEIIQPEAKGFWGMGSKEALVKLSKLEQLLPSTKSEQNQHLNNVHPMDSVINSTIGKAWVKDGVIYSQPSATQFPIVTIAEGIQLYKNKQLVEENQAVIVAGDMLETKLVEAIAHEETKWDVRLDDTKLTAWIDVEPGYKVVRKISDVEPSHHIVLKVEEQKEVYNHLQYKEIARKLDALHITYGLNQVEMIKAAETLEPSTFEVAKGAAPKQGKDGYIEWKTNVNLQQHLIENEDGQIDCKESKASSTVESGAVIAIIHPPTSGRSGYTATNELLPAAKTVPIIVQPKQGVAVIDQKVIVTASGRPHFSYSGNRVMVSVLPTLIHQGNVNESSGNIQFTGDVEIEGEVEAGMLVEAEGNILVEQAVNKATLNASGAVITRKNILNSDISAGAQMILVIELSHMLQSIHHNIEKMSALLKQLVLSSSFKLSDVSSNNLQPLIRTLIEKKMKDFPMQVKKYVERMKKEEPNVKEKAWSEVGAELNTLFLTASTQPVSLDTMIQLTHKIEQLCERNKTEVEPNSYIQIENASSSRLYSSGNILVLGSGCINTTIHSGGMVKVNSTLRGGKVYAELGADIHRAGSDSGTATFIEVPEDQKIFIETAMEGTTIKIGSKKHTFKETIRKVTAALDPSGRLMLEEIGS
ncbi:DUF342 domain-containing protein [Priestia megaterium]